MTLSVLSHIGYGPEKVESFGRRQVNDDMHQQIGFLVSCGGKILDKAGVFRQWSLHTITPTLRQDLKNIQKSYMQNYPMGKNDFISVLPLKTMLNTDDSICLGANLEKSAPRSQYIFQH